MGLREKAVNAFLAAEEIRREQAEEGTRLSLLSWMEIGRRALGEMFPGEEIVSGSSAGMLLVDDLKFKIEPDEPLYLVLGVCDQCGFDIDAPVWSAERVGQLLLAFDRGEITCEHCKEEPKKPAIKTKVCPILPHPDMDRGCLLGECAWFEDTQERCSFWLMGHKMAFEFMEHDRRRA